MLCLTGPKITLASFPCLSMSQRQEVWACTEPRLGGLLSPTLFLLYTAVGGMVKQNFGFLATASASAPQGEQTFQTRLTDSNLMNRRSCTAQGVC